MIGLMKIVIFQRPADQLPSTIDDYVERLQQGHPGQQIDILDAEGAQGSDLARLYDVTSYPAVVVTTDDGSFQHAWQGELPLPDDIESYVRSI